jgi:hypothetical protein
MIREDFVIQSMVRRILVRSAIDYSKLSYGTVKGVVYVRGVFRVAGFRMGGDDLRDQDIAVKTLYSFEKKVRMVPGVADVIFQFLNWKKERGHWVPMRQLKRTGSWSPEEDRIHEVDLAALAEELAEEEKK